MTTFEYHPIANSFPLASTLELNSLKNNIQEYGLIQPIVLYEDKILDGRNRYRACREIGVEAKYETFTGAYEEALQYSNSLNASRRHLSSGQKAVIAALEVIATRDSDTKNLSIKKASLIYSANVKYIQRAIKIITNDPILANKIFNGEITLAMAEQEYYQKNRASIVQDQTNKGLLMRSDNNAFDGKEQERYQYLKEQDQHSLILMLMRQEGTLKTKHTLAEEEIESI